MAVALASTPTRSRTSGVAAPVAAVRTDSRVD
jgi:hypothetical protein